MVKPNNFFHFLSLIECELGGIFVLAPTSVVDMGTAAKKLLAIRDAGTMSERIKITTRKQENSAG